jgi:uncharacterized lipoprotein YmbA
VKRAISAVPALIGALAIVSCASLPTQEYYMLEYKESAGEQGSREAADAVVRVLDAEVPKPYDRDQIVIRERGPLARFSRNAYWAVDLSETLSLFLARRMETHGLFAQVERGYVSRTVDLEVRMAVVAIERVEQEAKEHARVALRICLSLPRSSRCIVEYSGDESLPLDPATAEEFVTTVNHMLLAQIDAFCRRVGDSIDSVRDELEERSEGR